MALSKTERQAAFLEWSLLSDGQRIALGYPEDRYRFAESIGTSDKTLQRDERDAEFVARLAARKRELASQAVPGAVLDAGEAAGAMLAIATAGAVAEMASVDTLMPQAMGLLAELIAAKDKQAIQILIGTPAAKAWFEASLRDETSEFSSMSLLELARLNCSHIDTETLEALVAERRAG